MVKKKTVTNGISIYQHNNKLGPIKNKRYFIHNSDNG